MDFTKIIKIKNRMCDTYLITRNCDKCPLSCENNPSGTLCNDFIFMRPAEAEELILQWNEEHPLRTRRQDLLEKHPDCSIDSKTGIPNVCARLLDYTKSCPEIIGNSFDDTCKACWDTPIEE